MPFDDFAHRLSAEYALFLLALAGRYQQIRAPGIEPYPGDVSDLSFDAGALASTFYSTAKFSLDKYLEPKIADATEEVADGLVVRKKEALARIRAMTLENVSQILTMARVGRVRFADVLRGPTGALGMLLQRRLGKIQFKTTDTAGRRWQAEKLFHFVVRDFAYQAWLDKRVEELRADGVTMITDGLNPAFSIDEFENVRGQYFHINSNAIPVPHVSP